jgi:hypothetical protein
MRPITTAAEAEQALDAMSALIAKLSGLIEEETALVHAGRVSRAVELSGAKAELTNVLYTSGERLKANANFLLQAAPARCAQLHRLQDTFRTVLQRNTIVLATTHAVSEGIMRRLSGDLARNSAPQVYGASGRAAAPHARYGQPLAVSRVL